MKKNLRSVINKRTKNLTIVLDEEPLLQINLKALKRLIDDSDTESTIDTKNNDYKKVNTFYKLYCKERNKYHEVNIKIENIKKTGSDYKKFKKAVDIAEDLNMIYEHYIKAQMVLFDKKNQFPDVGALITENAKNRAIRYLENIKGKTIKNEGELNIPQSEIDGSLKLNKKYNKALKKVKDGNATQLEARYVYQLLLAKSIDVPEYVTEFIKDSDNG